MTSWTGHLFWNSRAATPPSVVLPNARESCDSTVESQSGKYEPAGSFGTASSIEPTPVSQSRSR
jgi:hypothetical protein